MALYDITVPVFIKYLRNLERWMDKAEAHAQQKKFDPGHLLQARLAPDQFSFLRQVQAACDTAKYAVAKLCGREAPAHPDAEQTYEDLRTRMRSVVEYLDGFQHEDFAGAEERAVSHVWMQGKHVLGRDYVHEFALANFFFHVTLAYAILRHNGVELGKPDFIGGLSIRD